MKINNKKKNYADNLSTPKYIFKKCQKIWGVKCNIDVCATKQNRKCCRFISKKENFLNRIRFKRSDIFWGNFPHSKNKQFIIHTFKLWKMIGCRAVLLLPINTLCSTYARKYILPYVHISKKNILTGRITFLRPRSQKPSEYGSVNGYVTIYYGRRKL